MHSFDDQRLRYCDKGVAFLVNHADQSCKFSRARVVDAVLAHHEADPAWDGTNSVAGGWSRSLEAKIEKAILRILQRDVGKFVVCCMQICTCSSTGGILVQASHVPRGPSQRHLILQFTH